MGLWLGIALLLAGCSSGTPGKSTGEYWGGSNAIILGPTDAYALNASGTGWARLQIDVEEPTPLFVALLRQDNQPTTAPDGETWPKGAMAVLHVGHDLAEAATAALTYLRLEDDGAYWSSTESNPHYVPVVVEPEKPIYVWLMIKDAAVRISALPDRGPGLHQGTNHFGTLELNATGCAGIVMPSMGTGVAGQQSWAADFGAGIGGAIAWVGENDGRAWESSFKSHGTTPLVDKSAPGVGGRGLSWWGFGATTSDEAGVEFIVNSTSLGTLDAGMAVWNVKDACQ